MYWRSHREYLAMSVAPMIARARRPGDMSETGGQGQGESAPRVEDIERALVLAREVAAATAKSGAAKLRVEHLRALFGNGPGRAGAERMQAALEAAGLSVDPPLAEWPETVSLRVERGRATLAPEGRPTGPSTPASEGVSLADAQQELAADQADMRTPESIAALMPALILPVLAASFLGPVFGAIFAGLAVLTSTLLSRPGALANGKLGPLRMPASLARSFLLLSTGVAVGALAMSLALIAAGGHDPTPSDPNAPLDKPKPSAAPATTAPKSATTTPAAPAPATKAPTAAERKAAADRRARAQRRRRARASREPDRRR
jgi:hypothetical protein